MERNINFKGDDFMFKEVRTTIFDVLFIYGCTTAFVYVAYQVGKVMGKAEVADKKPKNNKKVYVETKGETC